MWNGASGVSMPPPAKIPRKMFQTSAPTSAPSAAASTSAASTSMTRKEPVATATATSPGREPASIYDWILGERTGIRSSDVLADGPLCNFTFGQFMSGEMDMYPDPSYEPEFLRELSPSDEDPLFGPMMRAKANSNAQTPPTTATSTVMATPTATAAAAMPVRRVLPTQPAALIPAPRMSSQAAAILQVARDSSPAAASVAPAAASFAPAAASFAPGAASFAPVSNEMSLPLAVTLNMQPIVKLVHHQCKICHVLCPSKEFLSEHVLRDHEVTRGRLNVLANVEGSGVLTSKDQVCPHCNKAFRLKTEYLAHQANTDNLSCIFCLQPFSCIGLWLAHVARDHLPKMKWTWSKSRQGEDEKPAMVFVCPVCRMQLSSKNVLLHHFSTHITNLKFRCQFCDKEYTTVKGLQTHFSLHMPH